MERVQAANLDAVKTTPITPQTLPAIPAKNVRCFEKFPRRRSHHHNDDRRAPGHLADEELRALGEFYEGPALLNMEKVELDRLQFLSCSERIVCSDPIRLWGWEWNEDVTLKREGMLVFDQLTVSEPTYVDLH